jgi:hypothetical protein
MADNGPLPAHVNLSLTRIGYKRNIVETSRVTVDYYICKWGKGRRAPNVIQSWISTVYKENWSVRPLLTPKSAA